MTLGSRRLIMSLNVNFPFDYLPDNLASNCWFAHSKFNRGLKLYRPPSAFLARINSYRTQNQFARALQELGRAVRTQVSAAVDLG